MPLIVEDGTGKPDADAFASLDYVNTYHAARGNAAWIGLTEPKEQAIRRATTYISEAFAWDGKRVSPSTQALAWPRAWVRGRQDEGVRSDVVPTEVQKATAEAALRELVTPGALAPDYTASGRVKSERVEGAVAVEYDLSRTDAESVRPQMLIVNDLISHLLAPGAGNYLVGSAFRA